MQWCSPQVGKKKKKKNKNSRTSNRVSHFPQNHPRGMIVLLYQRRFWNKDPFDKIFPGGRCFRDSTGHISVLNTIRPTRKWLNRVRILRYMCWSIKRELRYVFTLLSFIYTRIYKRQILHYLCNFYCPTFKVTSSSSSNNKWHHFSPQIFIKNWQSNITNNLI